MTHTSSFVVRSYPSAHQATAMLLAAATLVGCGDNHSDSQPGLRSEGGAVDAGGMDEAEHQSPGGECFSPSQPDDAYVNGASGCECSGYDGQSVCVSGAALSCDDGKWVSVEDGPCLPRGDDCAEVTDTWQSCLAKYETCSVDDDGKFCGRDSLSPAERPECTVNYDWSEKCSDHFDGIGSQIIEGCGFTWIRAHHADSTRNTIVDAGGTVVFQQWDDPLSTINPLGCRGGEIPECPELPDDVSSQWKDVETVERGHQCVE